MDELEDLEGVVQHLTSSVAKIVDRSHFGALGVKRNLWVITNTIDWQTIGLERKTEGSRRRIQRLRCDSSCMDSDVRLSKPLTRPTSDIQLKQHHPARTGYVHNHPECSINNQILKYRRINDNM